MASEVLNDSLYADTSGWSANQMVTPGVKYSRVDKFIDDTLDRANVVLNRAIDIAATPFLYPDGTPRGINSRVARKLGGAVALGSAVAATQGLVEAISDTPPGIVMAQDGQVTTEQCRVVNSKEELTAFLNSVKDQKVFALSRVTTSPGNMSFSLQDKETLSIFVSDLKENPGFYSHAGDPSWRIAFTLEDELQPETQDAIQARVNLIVEGNPDARVPEVLNKVSGEFGLHLKEKIVLTPDQSDTVDCSGVAVVPKEACVDGQFGKPLVDFDFLDTAQPPICIKPADVPKSLTEPNILIPGALRTITFNGNDFIVLNTQNGVRSLVNKEGNWSWTIPSDSLSIKGSEEVGEVIPPTPIPTPDISDKVRHTEKGQVQIFDSNGFLLGTTTVSHTESAVTMSFIKDGVLNTGIFIPETESIGGQTVIRMREAVSTGGEVLSYGKVYCPNDKTVAWERPGLSFDEQCAERELATKAGKTDWGEVIDLNNCRKGQVDPLNAIACAINDGPIGTATNFLSPEEKEALGTLHAGKFMVIALAELGGVAILIVGGKKPRNIALYGIYTAGASTVVNGAAFLAYMPESVAMFTLGLAISGGYALARKRMK